MRAHVFRQGLWGVANGVAVRLTTFASQLILATLLSASDFGVYAIAISIAAIAQTFRGAGVAQWQVQGGERDHHRRAADVFWLALAANCLLGLALCASAQPAASLYGETDLKAVLLVIGASFPLITSGSYFTVRLQVQLRIKEMTLVEATSASLRAVLTVLGAAVGLGPLAFVLPNFPCYILEHILGYYFVREKPWRLRANIRNWPNVLATTRWIMLATLGLTVGLQADYLVLGIFAPTTTVGYYYFAYQLTYQSATLVTANINRVLTSGLVAKSRALDADVLLRATRTIMILGGPIVMLMATAIDPLEKIIWAGKWDASVAVAIWLSLTLPTFLLSSVISSALVSSGHFKRLAAVNLLKALGVIALAAIAGIQYPNNPTKIAAVIAVGLTALHVAQCVWGLSMDGIDFRQVAHVSALGLVAAPILALATLWVYQAAAFPAWAELLAAPTTFMASYALIYLAVQRRRSGHRVGLRVLKPGNEAQRKD